MNKENVYVLKILEPGVHWDVFELFGKMYCLCVLFGGGGQQLDHVKFGTDSNSC